jgi:SAM-dependent methyltransferase
MTVLDMGCGTGEALGWLQEAVQPGGLAIGMDLATAHVSAARAALTSQIGILQGNLLMPPLRAAQFDVIWCANTINHLPDPLLGVRRLSALLRPHGQLALMQSSFQPEMFFAWDARLERCVQEAVRSYYRDRYELSERDLTSIRALVGLARSAGLRDVRPRTFTIERTAPLMSADEEYLLEAVFRGTWGARLAPYLATSDYEELVRLCDPEHPRYALRRQDFHYLQTFTVVTGRAAGPLASS